MVLCLSVCVSLLSVWCYVYLCFTAQCMVLCLCFTAQCMVLCLYAFHCSVYGVVFVFHYSVYGVVFVCVSLFSPWCCVCFLFLYDSRVQDVETRASLVKERSSF